MQGISVGGQVFRSQQPPCFRGLPGVVSGVVHEGESDSAALLLHRVEHFPFCSSAAYDRGQTDDGKEEITGCLDPVEQTTFTVQACPLPLEMKGYSVGEQGCKLIVVGEAVNDQFGQQDQTVA